MTRKIVYILMMINLALEMRAQDPHFSQYFSSPLTLNPANTGNFVGHSRLAVNYRNQWQGIGNPYITGTVSFDAEVMKGQMGSGNRLSVGALGLYDRTSGGALKSNYGSVSLGYQMALDPENINRLSIGFQATMANRRLDYSRISFASQFASFGFDLSLPTDPGIQTGALSYLDWSTGLMYSQTKEESAIYVGLSAYHLTRPDESFLKDGSNRLPVRMTVHGGGMWFVGDRGSLMVSGLVNMQTNAQESMLGVAYGQQLEHSYRDINLFVGTWYRLGDAVVPYVGYNVDNFQMGVSYDAVISGLNVMGTRNRSIEVSFIQRFYDPREKRRYMPCF